MKGGGGAVPYSACSKILYDDSIGCDEVGDYFATEADTMIDIVCEDDSNKDLF